MVRIDDFDPAKEYPCPGGCGVTGPYVYWGPSPCPDSEIVTVRGCQCPPTGHKPMPTPTPKRNEQADAEMDAWEAKADGYGWWSAGSSKAVLDGHFTSASLRELADLMDRYPPPTRQPVPEPDRTPKPGA